MPETPGPGEPPPELMEAAFEALDDLLFLFGPDGRLRYANEALLAVTGTSGDAVGELTPSSLVAEADADRVAAAVGEAIEAGEAAVTTDGGERAYRFRLRRLEGGEPVLVGVGRDLTEQRRAEHERQAIFDRMTGAFFAIDESWRLTYVNDRAREIIEAAMADPPADGDLVGGFYVEDDGPGIPPEERERALEGGTPPPGAPVSGCASSPTSLPPTAGSWR